LKHEGKHVIQSESR